jgi:hypothetical protein
MSAPRRVGSPARPAGRHPGAGGEGLGMKSTDALLLGKPLFALLAFTVMSPFLLYRGSLELFVYPEEKEPTEILVDRMEERRGNHRWLTLTGRAVPELGWTPPDRKNTFVPLVEESWHPGSPIRAVVYFSNVSPDASHRWPSTGDPSAGLTVTGFMAPPGAWDCARMFPGQALADPVVVIYAGQGPVGPGAGWFQFVAGLVFGLLVLGGYYQLFRRWRAWRAERAAGRDPFRL